MCANEHSDRHCQIDWGFDIFKHMEPSHNEENDLFNYGYRVLIDWEELRCPCGNKISDY